MGAFFSATPVIPDREVVGRGPALHEDSLQQPFYEMVLTGIKRCEIRKASKKFSGLRDAFERQGLIIEFTEAGGSSVSFGWQVDDVRWYPTVGEALISETEDGFDPLPGIAGDARAEVYAKLWASPEDAEVVRNNGVLAFRGHVLQE